MVAARWRGAGVKADRDQESRNANQSLTQNARDQSLASQAPDGEGKSQEWMRSGSNGYGQICLTSRWTWVVVGEEDLGQSGPSRTRSNCLQTYEPATCRQTQPIV